MATDRRAGIVNAEMAGQRDRSGKSHEYQKGRKGQQYEFEFTLDLLLDGFERLRH